jgi:glycosyltransferase involved in cell wall biosynthesis
MKPWRRRSLTFAKRKEAGMNVCFISHTAGMGGAERVLLEAALALKNEGCKVFTILPSSGPLEDRLKELGVETSVCQYKWWAGRRSSFKRLRKNLGNLLSALVMDRQIKRWDCDVVITNTMVIPSGALAAWLLRKPHIWYIHEFGDLDHGLIFHLGLKTTAWLIWKLSDCVIFNSQATYEHFRGRMPENRMRSVYCAAHVPARLDPSHNAVFSAGQSLTCLILGAVTEGKGQEDAIRAVGELASKGYSCELVIAGLGIKKYHLFLESLVKEYNISDRVRFLGFVDPAFPVIQQSDVLLMCSRCEAFGCVTVEAMKLGKPVIGTASGGTKELIVEGFNGFLYPVGDYRALAGKIQFFIERKEKLLEMGENARKWANERFNLERYGKDLMAVIESAVQH